MNYIPNDPVSAAFSVAMISDVECVELSTDCNGDLMAVNNGCVPATVRTVSSWDGVR